MTAAHYYVEDEEPAWWASIDAEAALAERWPDASAVRKAERPQLGMLADLTSRIADRVARGARSQLRDADMFIAEMEERTGLGRAHRKDLERAADARAARRHEQWRARMEEKGITVGR